jgi:hypothetical protein
VGQAGQFGNVGVGAVDQPPIQALLGARPVWASEDQSQVLGSGPGPGELLIGSVTGVLPVRGLPVGGGSGRSSSTPMVASEFCGPAAGVSRVSVMIPVSGSTTTRAL